MAEQEESLMSQGCFISNDPETAGFDLSSGTKWIYPENYPRRDYQFSIVQSALYNNTLVCLPTGLGKTFIAAVIMYNFWRWYPRGRVVFLAPTKPLVAQQIEACHNIMGIPSEQTIELTGAINQNKRQQAWVQKRVIFATPQTFQKDIQNGRVPCELIKCIVIDEAHKALGKHSYCEIVRMLSEKSKFFRILALSATPGSKIDHVREVIQNLLISDLELRDDTSPDITPYTNDRLMEKIIVHLDKDLTAYKDRYVGIMDPHVRVLVKNNIINGNAANISKGRIFMLMKQYESRPQKANNHGIIMKTLNILLTMYHAYELLIKHGLRAFYNFYASHSDKFWLEAELDLQLMLEDIKRYIGEFPIIRPLADGTVPDIPDDLTFGHSKFNKLRELLEDHFTSFARQNKSTRAIVFVEYRDIVNEVYVLLLQKRPLIRPQMFVGQAGQKQKQQLAALEDFRNNKVNVLISTSVGEEGLDVGEVDLIVCFDISTSTPTRLVQRMGRTGRKRSGRVVLLLTEGKEVQTLNAAMSKKDSLNNRVLQSSNITSSLYQSSSRMVPANLTPQCLPIFIKTQPKTPKTKGKKTKEPAEKNPRKNRKDAAPSEDKLSQASTSKADAVAKFSGSTQSSMMKFLTNNRQQKNPAPNLGYESDSGIICEEFQISEAFTRENPYAVIRPGDVKLLTSDSHALEFLTLCAMKKSESCQTDLFKIDRTWIPAHSPPTLRDFVVPSFDSLDFIDELKPYEGPLVDENSDHESDCIVLSDNENDCFEDFQTTTVESKYATKQQVEATVECTDSHFFHDFSSFDSKPIDKTNSKSQIDFEILTSDFDNDFSTFEARKSEEHPAIESNFFSSESKSRKSNPKSQKEPPVIESIFSSPESKSRKTNPKSQEKYPNEEYLMINTDFSSFESKSERSGSQKEEFPRHSSEETIAKTPAHVEVDFDEILNESSASEVSESQALIGDQANIFDELLDEDSTDDDLFGEQQQNITIVFNDNVIDSTRLSTKRSASRSPCRKETSTKKQRVSEADSSDTDSFVDIPGTPTKPKKDLSFVRCNDEADKKAAEVADPDSDQDLFDDIEFETQFTFKLKSSQEKAKEEAVLNQKKNESLMDSKKNESLSDVDKEITLMDEDKNEMLFDNKDKMQVDQENNEVAFKRKNQSSFEKEKNEMYKAGFGVDEDLFALNQEKIRDESKDKKESACTNKEPTFDDLSILKTSKSLENVSAERDRVNEHELSDKRLKESSIINMPDNLDLDDWSDDFDLASVAISKAKTEEKKFSSGFSLSSSKQSTSSGWISVDSESHQKKVLSLKNLKRPSKKIPKLNDNPKVMSVQARSNLRLLSLKPIFPEKDKDGFAMPQIKATKVSAVPSESTMPNVSDHTCSDKENSRPNWKRRKDNSMSPRFRKYHSANELSSRPKKRKRIRAKRLINEFIEDEAEMSQDVETSEGSSAEDEEDEDLGNFVSYTQDVPNQVDMTMHYLQSINKSPIRAGAFLLKPVRKHVPDCEIYSQPVSQVDDSYLHDSFCVGDETQANAHESSDESVSNDSILEDIESALESRRRIMRKKKLEKRDKFKCLGNNKKRIKSRRDEESSSSEDDVEALRKQVMEESMLFKSSKN